MFGFDVAVTAAPTFVPAAEFSATLRLTASAEVMALPMADQAPSPSSLTARTCTS